MSYGLNLVVLLGNLGADPEIKEIGDDLKVSNIRLATTEKSGDKEYTEWHRVSVWDALANVVEKYTSKGDQILVVGAIRTKKWEDKDGNDRYTTEVSVGGYLSKLVLCSGGTMTEFTPVSEEVELPL
jgi:single-strand DNA-binding protein